MSPERRRKLFVIIVGAMLLIAGLFSLATPKVPSVKAPTNMLLTSPSFKNNEFIPDKFTCDGGDINPALEIANIPPEAKSLTLIVDDPDAPAGTFTHWTVWNIAPGTAFIKEESKPPQSREGTTDFGRIGYGGPCPPPGKPHHYHFTLYALDSMLDLPEGASRSELEFELKKHRLIAETELVGLYQKQYRF